MSRDNGFPLEDNTLRVGFYGAGAMVVEVADVLAKRGHELVGCYDVRTPAAPLDALHVATVQDLVGAAPDIVIHATPRDTDLRGQLLELIEAGCPVVSISGIAHLRAVDPAMADELDTAAREHDVAVVGTGLNPGFALDLVPIFFGGACVSVSHVRASRVFDIAPYGEAVREMYGVGLDEAEFVRKVQGGEIGLHREIVHSVRMIADELDLQVERMEEDKLPVVLDGKVVGFRHVCRGLPAIEVEMLGVFAPEGGGETKLEISGDPGLSVKLAGGINNAGGRVVAARVANVLPWVLDAEPGLRSPAEMPVSVRARGVERVI